MNIRLNANESASFWEDIPQACIKPTGVHTMIKLLLCPDKNVNL